MSEEEPRTGIVEYLMDQGGLLAPVIGKEAAKALTTFIGGALVIPNAWFARIAQGIKDDGDARSAIKMAIAGAAAEHAAVDDALVERMSNRWLGEEVRKQTTRERVATLALEDLRQNPPEDDAEIDGDFLNRYTGYAEQASSDDMQKLFGRVLAGEIRRPGTYSLASLHVLSIMDKKLAQTVEEVAAWTLGDFIPFAGPMTSGVGLEKIGTLEDLGLLRSGMITKTYTANSAQQINFGTRFEEGRPGFSCKSKDGKETIAFDVATVTPVGQQIFGLASPQWSDEEVRTVGSALLAQSGVVDVLHGTIAASGAGHFKVTNLKPFDPPLSTTSS